MPRDLRLSAINIYPIKSLAGIALDSARVHTRGLQYDRRFALVGEDGQVFTQRDNPVLATLKTRVNDDGISIFSPFSSVFIKTPVEAPKRTSIYIWYNDTEAADCGDEVAEWFSKLADTPVRLLY